MLFLFVPPFPVSFLFIFSSTPPFRRLLRDFWFLRSFARFLDSDSRTSGTQREENDGRSKLDYSMIFGRFGNLDAAVPFKELVAKPGSPMEHRQETAATALFAPCWRVLRVHSGTFQSLHTLVFICPQNGVRSICLTVTFFLSLSICFRSKFSSRSYAKCSNSIRMEGNTNNTTVPTTSSCFWERYSILLVFSLMVVNMWSLFTTALQKIRNGGRTHGLASIQVLLAFLNFIHQ